MPTVNSLMVNSGDDAYYGDSFRNVLEDHLPYLRAHPTTIIMDITPHQAHKYEFDLIGLLNDLRVEAHLHFLVARMNFMNTITEVTEDITQLLVPDPKEISKILQTHRTTNRIN